MASTILSKLSEMDPGKQSDPIAADISGLASEILSSFNPNKAFSEFVNKSEDAKKGMEIVKGYGNGDPKVAFMNYAKEKGKEALAQQIMSRLGLS